MYTELNSSFRAGGVTWHVRTGIRQGTLETTIAKSGTVIETRSGLFTTFEQARQHHDQAQEHARRVLTRAQAERS